MTREMIMRLSGPSRRSVDGFKAYGDTGRMLAANRSVNSERRYVRIRDSMRWPILTIEDDLVWK